MMIQNWPRRLAKIASFDSQVMMMMMKLRTMMVMILIQVGPGDGYRLSVKGFRNDLSTLYPQLLTAWVTIDWFNGMLFTAR